MAINEQFKIEFHPDAAARFTEQAQEALRSVRSFAVVETAPSRSLKIHPVATISSSDIIGNLTARESAINGLGEEVGRYWISRGHRVGWEGRDFESIKGLARRIGNSSPLRGRVSETFLLDELIKWLQETLEGKRKDEMPEYVAGRCSREIMNYEIWVPVYRTYSGNDFSIGDVGFRTISKELLDQCYTQVPPEILNKPEMAIGINRKRSRIQGSIAAVVKTKAEINKAREIAQSVANEAVGLLRFLSPVNWTCRLVSHCLPIGKENTRQALELLVENGAIKGITEESIEEGPAGWNLDEPKNPYPELTEGLHQLALNRDKTEFMSSLYGAFQLHSRHSIALEVPHKIVFVVAAIESLLLKDSQEPIQKNLGERMAFIIGNSLRERKEVVKNVADFYRIRSAFFHHGQSASAEDIEIIDKFFVNVWLTLFRLLVQADQHESKERLLETLEDLKLS